MGIESLLPDTQSIEEKFIYYCLSDSKNSNLIENKYIFDKKFKVVHKELEELYKNKTNFDIDTLTFECQKNCVDIDKNYLEDIRSKYKVEELGPIQDIVDKIKENFLRTKVIKNLENVALHFSDSKKLDLGKISELIENIRNNISGIENKKFILDTKDLSFIYKKILGERKKGINKRSYGLSCIDKRMMKPASPGHTTVLVASKDCGKSSLCKAMENALINKGICVLSINTEMEIEDNMDRIMSMREGILIDDLLAKDINPRLEDRVNLQLNQFENNPYFLYVDEPSIDLEKYDYIISQAKEEFNKRGILPEDEYVFVSIDLLGMLEEFSVADGPKQIEKAINKFHIINRRQRNHALALLQSNENQIRGKSPKKPKDVEFCRINLEHIKGASAFAERARVVFSLQRPLQLKKRFFPELMEQWEIEPDIHNFQLIKGNNERDRLFIQFVKDEYFRFVPYEPPEKNNEEVEKYAD